MKKLFFFVAIISAASCKHGKPVYYNHERWQIPGVTWRSNSFLKGKPKMVKETLFFKLNAEVFEVIGDFNNYDQYFFDEYGDEVCHKYYMSDSNWSITNIGYDDNGKQSRTYYGPNNDGELFNPDDSAKIITLFKGGKFIETNYDGYGGEGRPEVKFITFSDNGHTMKTERLVNKIIEDTLKDGSILVAGESDSLIVCKPDYTFYDDDDRIIRIVGSWGEGKYSTNYFYSKHQGPDSIKFSEGGKEIWRWVYEYDNYTDPIRYFVIADGKDTTEDSKMRYEYDGKGNWIKLLKRSLITESRTKRMAKAGVRQWIRFDSTYMECALRRREITY
jgi:hypothetical protein